MAVYICTFILSYILYVTAERKQRYPKLVKLLLLCVFVVAIMAGLRDTSVGTDTVAGF